jgi:hypothetical protein
MEKVVRIIGLKDRDSDYKYWQSRPIVERIEAIELLRSQITQFNKDVQPRLQRVCRIIKQS